MAEMGDHLATIDEGQKGPAVPLLGVEELGPHLTMWSGPSPTSVPYFHVDPSNCLATIHQRYRQTVR